MRKTLAAVAVAALAVSLLAPAAAARTRFPPHLDPRSWEVPEDMTWSDYTPIPGVDWKDPANQPPRTLRAALILGDFTDQKFRIAETTVDVTGQKGLGVEDPAQYWLDYLFYDTDPNSPTHGHTVGEYWLEDSFGLIGVDAEAFGPYTMDGPEYQYGLSGDAGFGRADDCPDDSGCNTSFDQELLQKSTADVTAATATQGDFDFRFLLHAGYDESGVWNNFGQMAFNEKEDVTEPFGPTAFPNFKNWAGTRYIDWTSWWAATAIWSHAVPGTLATEGESDGPSVYEHELSHIFGILDNYNNPYAENPDRAYSGPWDMMSRGTFNGPGGPWERWTIPPDAGATMGSHHMVRNKLRLGFIPAAEVLTVQQSALDATGVVTARILQRESPPAIDDPNVSSGLRIKLDQDASSCDPNKPKCDGGRYDFYDVEVVNRQGFDSFIPDHGVLISKSKTADASPFIWVIDAHPKNMRKVDFVTPDGTKHYYTVGDYRQLADAAFHVGTAPGTRNRYADKANGLAFYVLEKHSVEGERQYTVAVQSLSTPGMPEAAEVKRVKGKPVRGEATKMVFSVTNPSVRDAVFRLVVRKKGAIKHRLLNDLVLVPATATRNVVVWVKLTGASGKLKLIAKAPYPAAPAGPRPAPATSVARPQAERTLTPSPRPLV